MTITSNHRDREFKCRWDVPEKVLSDDFTHLTDEDDYGFFRYRGHWFHIGEFLPAPPDLVDAGWDAFACDSFFSGTVLRLTNDGDTFQVGLVIS